jgi:hypothetical protein
MHTEAWDALKIMIGCYYGKVAFSGKQRLEGSGVSGVGLDYLKRSVP